MGKKVTFAKNLAVVGVLSGLAIAIAVPFLAFAAANRGIISGGGAIAITIICVLAGAPIVLVSAFFGIVIPSSVEKAGDSSGDSVTVHGDKNGKQARIELRNDQANRPHDASV
jgi:uncharacterized membrane protein YcjF (UPF0283 family)